MLMYDVAMYMYDVAVEEFLPRTTAHISAAKPGPITVNPPSSHIPMPRSPAHATCQRRERVYRIFFLKNKLF